MTSASFRGLAALAAALMLTGCARSKFAVWQ